MRDHKQRQPVRRPRSRRAPAPPSVAPPAAPDPPDVAADAPREALLAKYRDLCQKYHDLVTRHEQRVAEESGAISLALTVMRTSTTGLALFVGDRIAAQNAQFAELGRVEGEWRRVGASGAVRRSGSLRDVAAAEVGALLGRGEKGETVGRYEHRSTGKIVDVHVERGGRDRSVAVIVHDVTESCRADRELHAAREAAFEQQRMRAVGELASGVAHDLNNVLHAMAMRLEAMRRSPALAAELRRHVESLGQIVGDAATRVARLQEFARQRRDAPQEVVDLAAILRDAVALGRTEMEATSLREDGRRVAIELSLEPVPPVSGIAAELRHVFLNLILNARDAMRDGGTIRIAAREDDGQVLVTVSDDGPGVPPENSSRIFEPFFTTKAEKGTGLGLSVAYGVMRRLGGAIAVANADGGGAVFTLRFPVARPDTGERPSWATEPGSADGDEPGTPTSPGFARGRVLVVDDDADNLEAIRFVLEDLGHEVATAPSGGEAVALFRSGARYELVLCDIGMPGMNGWQTAREIRAIAPDARIQMLTGWAAEIAPDDPLRSLADGVLPKPLPLDQLQRLLGAQAS